MKRYIKSSIVRGRLADTGERCEMQANGYFIGEHGRKYTAYTRVDKDIEYTDDGTPVHRQYTMDRQHRFWVETEDEVKDWE